MTCASRAACVADTTKTAFRKQLHRHCYSKWPELPGGEAAKAREAVELVRQEKAYLCVAWSREGSDQGS